MQRGSLEDAPLQSLAVAHLGIVGLQDDTQALHEEDEAKQGQQQFLVYDDGCHADDAADGQAARIAHEHLGGIGIVPEEANQCADEGTDEDDEFLGTWDVHDVQVGCHVDVTAHVCQDAQRYAHDRRIACAEAVHAVVQVRTVADGHHDEGGDEDEEYPAGCRTVLAQEPEDVCVVEVVVLDERDGGDGALHLFAAMRHHLFCALTFTLDVLADDGVGTHPERQADDQTEHCLSQQLPDGAHAVLRLLHLDVVVGKAKSAEPQGGEEHEEHVDVAESAQQQTG